MITPTEAVRNGAAFLDEHRPGWYNEIDDKRLELHIPDVCVLGQLGPGFTDGHGDPYASGYVEIIQPVLGGRPYSAADTAKRLGFLGPSIIEFDDIHAERRVSQAYSALTEAWIEAIQLRRASDELTIDLSGVKPDYEEVSA